MTYHCIYQVLISAIEITHLSVYYKGYFWYLFSYPYWSIALWKHFHQSQMWLKFMLLLLSVVIVLALYCTTLRSSTVLPSLRMARSQRWHCCWEGSVMRWSEEVHCQSVSVSFSSDKRLLYSSHKRKLTSHLPASSSVLTGRCCPVWSFLQTQCWNRFS